MSITTMLNSIRKQTGSSSYKNSKFKTSNMTFLDTGIYSLNSLISGDFFGGFPTGRICLIGGESATSKSYIAAQTITNALLKHEYKHIFILDSEMGALYDFIESKGCDMNNIEQILIENVEECQVSLLKIYDEIKKHKESNPEDKFLIIIDSLGAMVASKLLVDATKGKVASEMGGRAKKINAMIKSVTIPAVKTDTSLIILNHVYQNPGAMFTSKIMNQSGGLGITYQSRISLQLTKKLEKNDNRDDGYYGKNIINVFSTKNSIVKPFFERELIIDFNKGFDKYSGIFDLALKYGFIENPKSGYFTIPGQTGDKLLRRKDIEKKTEYYDNFLQELNEKVKMDMQYSSDELEMLDETEDEVLNIEPQAV